MKKKNTAVAALAICATVSVFGAAASASAADCTPKDAWTEIVTIPGKDAVGTPTITIDNPDYVAGVPAHDAVGEPTMTVDNPDYVAPTYTPGYWLDVAAVYTPAVGEKTITVTVTNPDYVPAVAEVPEVSHTDYTAKRYVVDVAHQDAVVKTQWKYERHGGYGTIWVDNDTFKYIDQDGNGSNRKPDCDVFYERTQKTRTVEVTPEVKEQGHWDQQTFHEQPGSDWTVISTAKHVTQGHVDAKDAVGEPTIEKIIDNPDYIPATYTPATKVWIGPVYTPAKGEKTITVDNPDYQPATDAVPAVGEPTLTVENTDYVAAVADSVKTVEHAAVTCGTVTVKTVAHTMKADALAQTGGATNPWLLGAAGVLLAGGAACAIGAGATKRSRNRG